MLSYQHIYHAGNFADVQKHAVLVKLLKVLAQKPQKFCVMDTHAGRGLYDLMSDEAQKINEFQYGVMPFWAKRDDASVISDYMKIVAGFNKGDDLKTYPGSAKIARTLMRAIDSLVLIERHPGEFAELQKCFTGVANTKVEQKDGYEELINRMPFAERRGLVLIDPSYEIKTEYTELPRKLQQAYKKWPQGQFVIWYPMLAAGLHRQLLTAMRNSAMKDMLVSEIVLESTPEQSFGMHGSGVIIVNPPFGFEPVLNEVTQYIARHLPVKARSSVFWLDNQPIDSETGLLLV